ncbi:MAG: hypothetical protein PHY47_09540 [Lachnospiraceae bacterium]|nr:hypothetical protein [Lachnospiraceae bacterium]
MIKYSENKDQFAASLKKVSSTIFIYISDAIKEHYNVNFADEYPRYKLSDVGYDSDTNIMSFYFENDNVKEIDLNIYEIKQSNSVPYEFYFQTISDSSNDYFVIIFNC